MVNVEIVLDQDGILLSCRASGHAGAGKSGADIVCAAVSVLIRTVIRTLSKKEGVVIRGDAPEPGLVWMEADYSAEGKASLAAAGEFLAEGLGSVAEEFPDNCKLIVRTDRRT